MNDLDVAVCSAKELEILLHGELVQNGDMLRWLQRIKEVRKDLDVFILTRSGYSAQWYVNEKDAPRALSIYNITEPSYYEP